MARPDGTLLRRFHCETIPTSTRRCLAAAHPSPSDASHWWSRWRPARRRPPSPSNPISGRCAKPRHLQSRNRRRCARAKKRPVRNSAPASCARQARTPASAPAAPSISASERPGVNDGRDATVACGVRASSIHACAVVFDLELHSTLPGLRRRGCHGPDCALQRN